MWTLRWTRARTLTRTFGAALRGAATGPPKSASPLILQNCKPMDTYLELLYGANAKRAGSDPEVRPVGVSELSRAGDRAGVRTGDPAGVEEEVEVVTVDYVWLRDHCRSPGVSVRSDTGQRLTDTAAIPLDLRPSSARVAGNALTLTWPDGHVSEFEGWWLLTNGGDERHRRSPAQPPHPQLWDWSTLQGLAQHDPAVLQGEPCYEEVLRSDEVAGRVLGRLFTLGFALVGGTPPTLDATSLLAQRFAFIRETVFGRMWQFSADGQRSDSAYTAEALDRHTDTAYLYEPARVQVFHVLAGATRGGRTLLVDGFRAAAALAGRRPDSLRQLAATPVTHTFVENGGKGAEGNGGNENGGGTNGGNKNGGDENGGNASGGRGQHLLRATRPVMNIDDAGQLAMICYNNYDRVSLGASGHEEVRRWYLAHRHLTALLRELGAEAWFQLQPGTVLLIDNWRVLHGREAFSGPRRVCGCYLPHDDLMDTGRRLGLLA